MVHDDPIQHYYVVAVDMDSMTTISGGVGAGRRTARGCNRPRRRRRRAEWQFKSQPKGPQALPAAHRSPHTNTKLLPTFSCPFSLFQ
ncbi:hypothetical protein BDFB_014870 [Asbolus verrucosus]|uniref:Uncharacterized protein n=1 Tax=Asbolus verrucosus TaxID=1661398 RepID=A0A482W8Z4_ASBVE|nr:hypothetical protein BDFB_014870 [Asbolus verrucosus]